MFILWIPVEFYIRPLLLIYGRSHTFITEEMEPRKPSLKPTSRIDVLRKSMISSRYAPQAMDEIGE